MVPIAIGCQPLFIQKEPNPKFLLPVLANSKFTPINGNCDGDEKNLIRANSDDLSKYPSLS